MINQLTPIGFVVDTVAAAVRKAWDKTREEQPQATDVERGALHLAYFYLSARQSAVYKLERERHVDEVRTRYQRPPSAEKLYISLGEERSSIFSALFAVLVATIAAGALVGIVFVLQTVLINLPSLMEVVGKFLISEHLIILLSSLLYPTIAVFLGNRFLQRPLEYVFAGVRLINWRLYQAASSQELGSERALVLAMAGFPSEEDGDRLPATDPDLPNAKEHPVPIQPGISDFVFVSRRLTVDDLGSDFRLIRRQHEIVFWASFVLFLLLLIVSVGAAVLTSVDLKAISAIGAIGGVLGVFSYKMLSRARLARIALALFNSYVIELERGLAEASTVKNRGERVELTKAAWTNFRVGLNGLYALEQKDATQRDDASRNTT